MRGSRPTGSSSPWSDARRSTSCCGAEKLRNKSRPTCSRSSLKRVEHCVEAKARDLRDLREAFGKFGVAFPFDPPREFVEYLPPVEIAHGENERETEPLVVPAVQ